MWRDLGASDPPSKSLGSPSSPGAPQDRPWAPQLSPESSGGRGKESYPPKASSDQPGRSGAAFWIPWGEGLGSDETDDQSKGPILSPAHPLTHLSQETQTRFPVESQ